MREVFNDDFDSFFLRVKKELDQEEELISGEDMDFDMGFSIQIPHGFSRMEKEQAAEIFWSKNRPPVLFATPGRNEGITFQILAEKGDMEPEEYGKKAGQMLEQADSRTVFYGSGKEGETYWMEYKSFAARERVYNILFLFRAGEKMIMGTFYCLFQNYDIWKPSILHMLHTIKTEGTIDERI